jgi:hypothetical protein
MSYPYEDFFYQGELEFRRKRVLDDVTGDRAIQFDDVNFKQDALRNIYKNFERVSDKANIIMQASEKVARKYTIPVPVTAIEVRKAVARQDDNQPNGDLINFSLFIRMVDIIEDRGKSVDFSILNDHVADPLANRRDILQKIDKRLKTDDLLPFYLFGGQLLILYLMSEIQGMFRAPDTAQTGVDPVGGGPASAAVAIKQYIVGIAITLAVLGIQEAVKYVIQMMVNDPDLDTSFMNDIEGDIGEAKRRNLSPLVKKAKKFMGFDDYVTITRYCIKYISKTNERGYEFWLSYFMARKMRFKAGIRLGFKHLYVSDSAQIDPNGSFVRDPGQPPPAGSNIVADIATNLAANAIDIAITEVPFNYVCAREEEVTFMERGLDALAQILDTKLARDVICCLVAFLGNVDTKILSAIRTLLNAYVNINIVNLDLAMTNMLDFLLSWLRDAILEMIWALIQILYDKIVQLVLDFFESLGLDMDIIIECPLILDLILALLDAIDDVLQLLNDIVVKYVEMIMDEIDGFFGLDTNGSDEAKSSTGALNNIYIKKRMRTILLLLDQVVGAIENSLNFCSQQEFEGLSPKEQENFITFESIVDSPAVKDLDDYLDIDYSLKETHFPNAGRIELSDGRIIPSYDKGELTIGDGNPSAEGGLNSCFDLLGGIRRSTLNAISRAEGGVNELG